MLREEFEKRTGNPPTICAYAPGRLEFIGNHTDYNGGLVMGAAIDRGLSVAAAPRDDGKIRMWTLEGGDPVIVPTSELTPLKGAGAWANYPLGVWSVLSEDAGMNLPGGADLVISGNLPAGAGLSSSAALELATAKALDQLSGLGLEHARLAALCRKAENVFVGMPCGILDQGVSAFGETDHLVKIDCHSEAFSIVPMPPGVEFVVFHSGKKHSLVDSMYATRHSECFEAYDVLKRNSQHPSPCLAHFSPHEVEQHRDLLSEPQYRRALHVTREHRRVEEVARALESGDMAAVGKLLVASHESSRDLFENSLPELDFLVATLAGWDGVWGARLTGGGFGGAVMAVTQGTFTDEEAAKVAALYEERFELECRYFRARTGPGARIIE